jgi:prefoldin subunit 5
MSYINADMNAITQLASNIDQYESDIRKLQQSINDRFNQLGVNGKWSDDKYKEYSDKEISELNEQMNYLYRTIENDLRPFLQDFYQRLREYQESW